MGSEPTSEFEYSEGATPSDRIMRLEKYEALHSAAKLTIAASIPARMRKKFFALYGVYISFEGFTKIAEAYEKAAAVKLDMKPMESRLRSQIIENVRRTFANQGPLKDDLRFQKTASGAEHVAFRRSQAYRIVWMGSEREREVDGKWRQLSARYADWKMNRQKSKSEIKKQGYRESFSRTGWWLQSGGRKAERTSYIMRRELAFSRLNSAEKRRAKEAYKSKKEGRLKTVSPKSRFKQHEKYKSHSGAGAPIGILTGDMFRALTARTAYGSRQVSAFGTNRYVITIGVDARKIPHLSVFMRGRKRGRGEQPGRAITFFTPNTVDDFVSDVESQYQDKVQAILSTPKMGTMAFRIRGSGARPIRGSGKNDIIPGFE